MSRYCQIIGTKEVCVGWDRPLSSYFGQVFDLEQDDETLLVNVGFPETESIQRLDALAEALGEYGTVVDDFWGKLHMDRDLDLEPR